MKIHHYIFLTTILFVILFYDQSAGLNLGIIGWVYAILTLIRTPQRNRTRTFIFLFIASILSCSAFAWFGDFASFTAVATSLLMLGYRSRNRKMKVLLLLPVFVTNFFTSFVRIFNLDDWLPKRNVPGLWQKTLAFVLIPLILMSVFFGIYAAGSDHFANLFTNVELDVNFWQLAAMIVLGSFIAFNYWNFAVPRFIYKSNRTLDNDFKQIVVQRPTYSFLDLDAERMSGVISLCALNILLVFFIATYNYEQFYEAVKTPVRLSEETHEQVNAVIMSIVMSILVMMFYFKSGFNFDPKARFMKILAKIWIVLNAVLIISALVKNSEYIINYGFTYKRLGVYAFLILSLIGLVLTFIKIQFRKRNAFLFNTMAWFVYGTVLICSCVNWGGFITAENMKRKDFALNYHRTQINFSEKQLLNYAEEKNDLRLKSEILNSEYVKLQQKETFLSSVLFYRTLPLK